MPYGGEKMHVFDKQTVMLPVVLCLLFLFWSANIYKLFEKLVVILENSSMPVFL